jgi:hypothetical protein
MPDVVISRTTETSRGTTYELIVPVVDPVSGYAWRCAAELTVPPRSRQTLQILVHGGTYSRWYWDPVDLPERYSYTNTAASRGFPTINIDRIGSGRSDQPDGTNVTLDLHAATVTTIARLARERLAGYTFSRVVGAGHSMGTRVLTKALNGEHGLDAAVLTGISHQRTDADPGGFNRPASADVRFAQRNVTGYLQIPAEFRHRFYHVPAVDADVLDADCRNRDVVAIGDLFGIEPVATTPSPAAIPLCVVLGAADWLYRAEDSTDFRTAEAAWYPEASTIDFLVYENTGHNINLHHAGPQAMSDYLDWVAALA